LNYFSEAESSEVKVQLADADSWRITGSILAPPAMSCAT